MRTIWSAKDNYRVTLSTDNVKFIAQINAGRAGETFLSIGYSCPNYAQLDYTVSEEQTIEEIQKKLDEEWNKIEEKDLMDMLPDLLRLCTIANKIYNFYL